jgi:hypothetical protein
MGNAHIEGDSSSLAKLLFMRDRVIAARKAQSAVR